MPGRDWYYRPALDIPRHSDVPVLARRWYRRAFLRNGAGDGIRTHDFLLGKQTLYR